MTRFLPRRCPTATLLLLVFGLGVAGAQGPRRDVGRNIPLPAIATEVPNGPTASANDVTDENLITVDVVVTDASGQPLRGLQQEQIKLFVDGTEHRFRVFRKWVARLPQP